MLVEGIGVVAYYCGSRYKGQRHGKYTTWTTLSTTTRRGLSLGAAALLPSRSMFPGMPTTLSDYGVDIAEAAEALPSILTRKDRPTAIFCYNDPVAEQTIPHLLDSGLSIPNDISLLGFGNEQSGDCPVALTTFDQHPQLIGKTAAEIYLERVNGKTGTRRELITPDLVIRSSTASIS